MEKKIFGFDQLRDHVAGAGTTDSDVLGKMVLEVMDRNHSSDWSSGQYRQDEIQALQNRENVDFPFLLTLGMMGKIFGPTRYKMTEARDNLVARYPSINYGMSLYPDQSTPAAYSIDHRAFYALSRSTNPSGVPAVNKMPSKENPLEDAKSLKAVMDACWLAARYNNSESVLPEMRPSIYGPTEEEPFLVVQLESSEPLLQLSDTAIQGLVFQPIADPGTRTNHGTISYLMQG